MLDQMRGRLLAAGHNALALALLCGCGSSGGDPVMDTNPDLGQSPATPQAIRALIGSQVGGLSKLTVPPDDASIPVPPDDPQRPGRYKTTPAKTYLGKLLFHDPVRTARINANTAQPLDLPAGTAFGGTVRAADVDVPRPRREPRAHVESP